MTAPGKTPGVPGAKLLFPEHSGLIYSADVPAWLDEFCAAPEMRRLRGVGMNCGCEYTAFPRFRGLPPYSRFRHSVGVCLIVWRFTGDMVQALAGLFHDIATPCFAHTVDFLRGDYMAQESTEDRTEGIIRASAVITRLLDKYGVAPGAVTDYHMYPIADNDSPCLSADRLEYTLGNLEGYGLCDTAVLQAYYDGIIAAEAENGAAELAFTDVDTARHFAHDALKMSRIYVADEDRYAMQMLSELLRRAVEKGVLTSEELYLTEADVIARLTGDGELCARWQEFRAMHRMLTRAEDAPDGAWRVIRAKKRYIDPLVAGRGRLSKIDAGFAAEAAAFLAAPQDAPLCAI